MARAVVVVALALMLGGVNVPPVVAANPPKVAIIVGASGSSTAHYRDLANAAAAKAAGYGARVVKVYSPNATWSKVRTALTGASIVIYFGPGRGYPSPYSSRLATSYEDGLGLNPSAGHGNTSIRFYGEKYVRSVALAPNAVVLLHMARYASGTGNAGSAGPSLSTARRRVDNYAAGFLAAGAAAVIAERTSGPSYYLRTLFTGSMTLDAMWRGSPTAHGHITSFRSTRTPGATGRTDPVGSKSRYDRSIVGRLGVSTTAVVAPPASTPSPAVYGPAINADNLNNSPVGGNGNRQVAYRFRATETSTLTAVRIYLVSGSGYSGGNGGSLEISVRADDGSSAHLPATTSLASVTIRPGNPVSIGDLPLISFPSPATLVSGQLYHVVFRNMDSSPTQNYVSLDGLFTFGTLTRWQPPYPNTDWANLIWSGGAWSADRGAGKGVITPIMALSYGNGHVGGVGYMEVWVGLPKSITGSKAVREQFTVSGSSRTVSSVSVRVKRVSGTSPLQVRLETSSGAVVDQGVVPSASISTSGYGTWGTVTFATPRTLAAGQGYRLVLAAASDTEYSTFVIREGAAFGFPSATYFADGTAQYTTNGSTWVGFDQPGGRTNLTIGDLQFLFQ